MNGVPSSYPYLMEHMRVRGMTSAEEARVNKCVDTAERTGAAISLRYLVLALLGVQRFRELTL